MKRWLAHVPSGPNAAGRRALVFCSVQLGRLESSTTGGHRAGIAEVSVTGA